MRHSHSTLLPSVHHRHGEHFFNHKTHPYAVNTSLSIEFMSCDSFHVIQFGSVRFSSQLNVLQLFKVHFHSLSLNICKCSYFIVHDYFVFLNAIKYPVAGLGSQLLIRHENNVSFWILSNFKMKWYSSWKFYWFVLRIVNDIVSLFVLTKHSQKSSILQIHRYNLQFVAFCFDDLFTYKIRIQSNLYLKKWIQIDFRSIIAENIMISNYTYSNWICRKWVSKMFASSWIDWQSHI